MNIRQRQALIARILDQQETIGAGPVTLQVGSGHDGQASEGFVQVICAPPLMKEKVRRAVDELNRSSGPRERVAVEHFPYAIFIS